MQLTTPPARTHDAASTVSPTKHRTHTAPHTYTRPATASPSRLMPRSHTAPAARQHHSSSLLQRPFNSTVGASQFRHRDTMLAPGLHPTKHAHPLSSPSRPHSAISRSSTPSLAAYDCSLHDTQDGGQSDERPRSALLGRSERPKSATSCRLRPRTAGSPTPQKFMPVVGNMCYESDSSIWVEPSLFPSKAPTPTSNAPKPIPNRPHSAVPTRASTPTRATKPPTATRSPMHYFCPSGLGRNSPSVLLKSGAAPAPAAAAAAAAFVLRAESPHAPDRLTRVVGAPVSRHTHATNHEGKVLLPSHSLHYRPHANAPRTEHRAAALELPLFLSHAVLSTHLNVTRAAKTTCGFHHSDITYAGDDLTDPNVKRQFASVYVKKKTT